MNFYMIGFLLVALSVCIYFFWGKQAITKIGVIGLGLLLLLGVLALIERTTTSGLKKEAQHKEEDIRNTISKLTSEARWEVNTCRVQARGERSVSYCIDQVHRKLDPQIVKLEDNLAFMKKKHKTLLSQDRMRQNILCIIFLVVIGIFTANVYNKY